MFTYRILINRPGLKDDPGIFLREIVFETEKNFDVRDPNARTRLMDEFFRWQIKTALDMGVDPENYTFSVLKEEKVA